VDSAGETIDFLPPKRDPVCGQAFLKNGLVASGRIRPRVIEVDGHAAYPQAIRELKASGELGRHASVGQLHT